MFCFSVNFNATANYDIVVKSIRDGGKKILYFITNQLQRATKRWTTRRRQQSKLFSRLQWRSYNLSHFSSVFFLTLSFYPRVCRSSFQHFISGLDFKLPSNSSRCPRASIQHFVNNLTFRWGKNFFLLK